MKKTRHTLARALGRRAAATAVLAAAAGLLAPGTAYADESTSHSRNAPHVYLFEIGQIDDPMEDVLEHTLLLGDGYRWD